MKEKIICLLVLFSSLVFGNSHLYKVKATTLLIRSQPNTQAVIVGRFYRDEIVEVLEITDKVGNFENKPGAWMKVKFENKYGYVFGGFLMPAPEAVMLSRTNHLDKSFYANLKIITNIKDCGKSVLLATSEYAYGPPSIPNIIKSREEYLKRGSEIDRELSSDKLYEYAYLAYHYKDWDRVEKYFNKSLKLNNFEVPYYKTYINYYFANSFEQRGDYGRAKEFYQHHGDKYYLHLIEAKIFESIKELDLAEKEFLLAQSVNLYEMLNYDPFLNLAKMFYKYNQSEKAVTYLQNYILCAKIELVADGIGYSRSDDEHINSAQKFLKKIKSEIKE